MARRYGRMNRYDSRLRRCAISGLRYYQSDLIRKDGSWVHPKFYDEDGFLRTRNIGAVENWDWKSHTAGQSYWMLDGNDQSDWASNNEGSLLYGDIMPKDADDQAAFTKPSDQNIWCYYDLDADGDLDERDDLTIGGELDNDVYFTFDEDGDIMPRPGEIYPDGTGA